MATTTILDQRTLTKRRKTLKETGPVLLCQSHIGLTSGAAVASWPDTSGHGNHLVQATGGSQPTCTASQINGFPSVVFTAHSLAVAFGAALTQAYTICVVAKATAAGVIFDSSSGDHSQLARNSDSRYEFSAGTSLDSVHVDTAYHIFQVVVDGDTSIINCDGDEQFGAAGAATLTGVTIGCDNAAANALTGAVALVAVWDRALTYAERRMIGKKLARRYGLEWGPLKVLVNGTADTFYTRIPWTATTDYIDGMDLTYTTEATASADYRNDVVGFRRPGTVETSRADSSVTALAAPTVATFSSEALDDIAPFKFNNTFIGGDHGASFIREVTANGHGKDSTDLGSSWTDGAAVTWYLMRVVDENKLWMLSANAASDNWTFTTTITGNFTHAVGATHTTGITVGSSTLRQFFPATKTSVRGFYKPDGTQITADGTYRLDYLDVRHTYTIKSIDAQLDAAIAGNKTEVDYDAAAITDVATVTITYRWLPNSAVVVKYSVTFHEQVNIDYFGFMQLGPLTVPSGGSRHLYVPKVAPYTPVATEYDFEGIEDITALAEVTTLPTSCWRSATDPPDRYICIIKTSDPALYSGVELAYDITSGVGVPATRAAAIPQAMSISTSTKKIYPYAVAKDSTTYPTVIAANTTFTGNAVRCPLNFGKYATPTAVAWWQVEAVWYAAFDFHANYDAYVAVPPEWTGKTVTVLAKHANATVNSTTVNKAGISITVTDSFGWALVKIT